MSHGREVAAWAAPAGPTSRPATGRSSAGSRNLRMGEWLLIGETERADIELFNCLASLTPSPTAPSIKSRHLGTVCTGQECWGARKKELGGLSGQYPERA